MEANNSGVITRPPVLYIAALIVALVLHWFGPLPRRWLKVKQKGWTDAEDRWQRRISVRGARKA